MSDSRMTKFIRIESGFYRTADGAYEILADTRTSVEGKMVFGKWTSGETRIVGWRAFRVADRQGLGLFRTLAQAKDRIICELNKCPACGGLGVRYGHITCVPCLGTGCR